MYFDTFNNVHVITECSKQIFMFTNKTLVFMDKIKMYEVMLMQNNIIKICLMYM